jgi:hypothetical protein
MRKYSKIFINYVATYITYPADLITNLLTELIKTSIPLALKNPKLSKFAITTHSLVIS